MTVEKLILLSVTSLGLTLVFSWIGDDDVIYAYLKRKPTPKEMIARARYVFAKFFATLYGGSLLAVLFVQDVLKGMFSLNVSQLQSVCLIGPCWVVFCLFIGVIQNWVRLFQGRQQRSALDGVKASCRQWTEWRRRQGGG